MNSQKIILDLCGGSGSWSQPYRDAGYDVRVITWPENNVLTFAPPRNVYGILAAPPCTMFSLARRATAKTPRDFVGALNVVNACIEIIQECRLEGSLKFWALENPVGYLRQFLGKPPYTFQPWWFGSAHSKRTDLWGYFKEPRRTVQEKPEAVGTSGIGAARWQRPKAPAGFEHLNLDRAGIRSITPPEFARAFMEANR